MIVAVGDHLGRPRGAGPAAAHGPSGMTNRRGFVGLQYAIDDALFDGPPASVRRGGLPDAPRTSAAQVTIVDDCRALYWSDGTYSYPIELGHDLGVQPRWSRSPQGTTMLAEGDGWSVEIDRTGDEARVRYLPPPTDDVRPSTTRPGPEPDPNQPLVELARRRAATTSPSAPIR